MMTLLRLGLLTLTLLAAPVWADPLAQLPTPGTWVAFPNSTMRPAMPPNAPWNPAEIMGYSGGFLDADRDELGVWGGGHHDYSGNEVCLFALASGTWTCGPRGNWDQSLIATDPT